jgi:hypothetical protein
MRMSTIPIPDPAPDRPAAPAFVDRSAGGLQRLFPGLDARVAGGRSEMELFSTVFYNACLHWETPLQLCITSATPVQTVRSNHGLW